MKKSLETILEGLKNCKKVKCDNCPYEKMQEFCARTLLVDCAEILNLQAEIIKDMEAEQTRLKNENSALNKVLDCFKNDEDDETFTYFSED